MTSNLQTLLLSFTVVFFSNFSFSQNQDINIPESGNVGNVALNAPRAFTFTLANTFSGGSPSNNQLTVNSINVTGTNASEFVVSGITLPIVIDRAGSATFTVTFTPTASGNRTATLDISSNDPDENPYYFNLSGYGDPTLTSLTLLNTYPLTVLEPSGLAYNKVTNELFTVSDNTGLVYRMSTNGTVLQALNYPGSDLEGVSMYKGNKILIAVEGTRELVEYDYMVDNGSFTSHTMNYTNVDLSPAGDNSRIEGVTYDPINDIIYFLNEKNPGALIKADGSFNVIAEYPDPLNHGGDYSASFYEEETGLLWIGSDQTSTIYKCNTDGSIVEFFPVTTSGGTAIDKLEGIAIDSANRILYAVSDGGEELYVFQINDPVLRASSYALNENELKVYPIPTSNYLNVKLSRSQHISAIFMYSADGKVIDSFSPNNENLDVSHLKSGVYFLKVMTPDATYLKTVVIK